MHRLSSSFILAYHGCDEQVAERILAGHLFVPSQNTYDWLGHGIYFWEADPARGMEFAKEASRRPGTRITKPTVIGAVIDMGLCLDLTTQAGADQVRAAYDIVRGLADRDGRPLPANSPDGLRRNLDCTVVDTPHDVMRAGGSTPIDTVKGIFVEGPPLYPGSGFHEKTHVQVCARTLSCIKGIFRIPAP